jgi:hypothetical protein
MLPITPARNGMARELLQGREKRQTRKIAGRVVPEWYLFFRLGKYPGKRPGAAIKNDCGTGLGLS